MKHTSYVRRSDGKVLSLTIRIGTNYAFAVWALDDRVCDSAVLSRQGAREAWRRFGGKPSRVVRAGESLEFTQPEKF